MNPEIANWRQRARNHREFYGHNDPNSDYCDDLANALEAAEAEQDDAQQ